MISADLDNRINNFIRKNPGVSFTLIASQALNNWLNNSEISAHKPKVVDDNELMSMIEDDKELMEGLSE